MPRAGVTKEKVFAAAAAIADREGYHQLTLAAVAAEFGIRVPSLYKHVSGLEEVREHLATLGLQGQVDAVQRADGETPRERLASIAHALRDYTRKHPGLYAAAAPTHVKRGPQVQAAAKELLTIVFEELRSLSIPEDRLLDAARSFRSTLHGFVDLEMRGGFGLPGDLDASFEFLMEHWLRGWE